MGWDGRDEDRRLRIGLAHERGKGMGMEASSLSFCQSHVGARASLFRRSDKKKSLALSRLFVTKDQRRELINQSRGTNKQLGTGVYFIFFFFGFVSLFPSEK
jgi:hypothetical protein